MPPRQHACYRLRALCGRADRARRGYHRGSQWIGYFERHRFLFSADNQRAAGEPRVAFAVVGLFMARACMVWTCKAFGAEFGHDDTVRAAGVKFGTCLDVLTRSVIRHSAYAGLPR